MPHAVLRRLGAVAVLCVSAVVPLLALSTDAFTGTGALSASWTIQEGEPARDSGVAIPGVGGAEHTAYSTHEVWGNSHYSQITIASTDASGNAGVTVRASGTDASSQFYLLACGEASNSGTIFKFTGGSSYSSLHDYNTDYAATDTCKLEIVGTTLTAYKNGVSLGTPITNSDLTGGSPGIYFFFGSTQSSDDWQGDSIAAASANGLSMRGVGP